MSLEEKLVHFSSIDEVKDLQGEIRAELLADFEAEQAKHPDKVYCYGQWLTAEQASRFSKLRRRKARIIFMELHLLIAFLVASGLFCWLVFEMLFLPRSIFSSFFPFLN